uniref:Uncharacterized protein n=1 Tax=Tetranychus urticae TaxID=32264 RepID=T1JY15_TETUR
MKGTEDKMSYQGARSSAKSWLQGIFSVLVALNVISLIAAIVATNGSGISLYNCGVVLNIIRIILKIGIVFAVISIVAGDIAIGAIHGIT